VGVLLDDELRLVLAELDGRALASVRRCCRRCCELASSPDLWRELLASLVRQNHFAAATAFDENTLGCVRDIAAVLAQPQAWWVQPRMVVQRSACIAIDVQNTPRPSSSDEVQSAEGGDPTASGLSPSATGPLCQLSTPPDRLSVRFTGPHLGDNRAVRCEPPLPCASYNTLRFVSDGHGGHVLGAISKTAIAYYEVTIGERPADEPASSLDCIAVGLASERFPLCGRQPGWDGGSFGYHSDDGCFFHGSGTRSQPFGPRFKCHDVVGCGISLITRQVFFTLNGRYLGSPAFAKSAHLPLHPVVGIDSHASVRFNLGHSPFAYDLAQLPATLLRRPSPRPLLPLRWLGLTRCIT